jgi:hypothetical protein
MDDSERRERLISLISNISQQVAEAESLERFSIQCGRIAAVLQVSHAFLGREGVE